jgi:hypothetical protein
VRHSARSRIAFSPLIAAAAVVVATGTCPVGAQTRYQGPNPPGGRSVSTYKDCQALQKEWDDYKAAWTKQHQACLDGHKNGNIQAGPTCSKAPCQQLHYLVYEYGSSESDRMMSQCREAVDRIQKQKAEQEAAVRRYNEQVAEYNRKLLQAINAQNAAVAEQNRLAAEAVAERNRAAQDAFQRLVDEYKLKVDLQQQRAKESLRQMRDYLAKAPSALNRKVSDLVDDLGAVTFGDAVNKTADATGTASDVFDAVGVATDTEPPETVGRVAEVAERFSAAYNAFKAAITRKFDDLVSALSSSTTFLFPRNPFASELVSKDLEGVGRWGENMNRTLEETYDGRPPSNDQIKERVLESFPLIQWLKEKADWIDGKKDDLYQRFGSGASQ